MLVEIIEPEYKDRTFYEHLELLDVFKSSTEPYPWLMKISSNWAINLTTGELRKNLAGTVIFSYVCKPTFKLSPVDRRI